MTKTSLSR